MFVAITPAIVVVAPPVVLTVEPPFAPKESLRVLSELFPHAGVIPEKLVKAGLVFPPFLILDQSRMLVELLPNTGMMVDSAPAMGRKMM